MRGTTIELFKVRMNPRVANRVIRTLQSGYVGEGPRVKELEKMLGLVFGDIGEPLTTSSGTAALDLAYALLDLGPGDEVICAPLTCIATVAPLKARGVKIHFADIDIHTGCIDPESVRAIFESIRNRRLETMHPVKAVIAVDWGGTLCDYEGLREAAPGVAIVQDAAHSILAFGRDGKAFLKTAQRGDYVAFSFQAIKHFTTGDGGCLVTPPLDYQIYARAKRLRWFGLNRDESDSFRCSQKPAESGYKYAMNDIAASIGISNLPGTFAAVASHRENAERYRNEIEGNDGEAYRLNLDGIQTLPHINGGSYWLYTLLAEDRAGFIKYLANAGIAASPAHTRVDDMPCFYDEETDIPRPALQKFAARHVCIPVGWWLSEEEVTHIVTTIRDYAADYSLGAPDDEDERRAMLEGRGEFLAEVVDRAESGDPFTDEEILTKAIEIVDDDNPGGDDEIDIDDDEDFKSEAELDPKKLDTEANTGGEF